MQKKAVHSYPFVTFVLDYSTVINTCCPKWTGQPEKPPFLLIDFRLPRKIKVQSQKHMHRLDTIFLLFRWTRHWVLNAAMMKSVNKVTARICTIRRLRGRLVSVPPGLSLNFCSATAQLQKVSVSHTVFNLLKLPILSHKPSHMEGTTEAQTLQQNTAVRL